MRSTCRVFSMLLLVSCSFFAKAVTIRTADPNYTNLTYTPYSFSFSVCPTSDPYLDHGVAISADGCFGAVNEVNSTITSLTLSFEDTTAIMNSGPNVASSDLFSNSSVTESNGILSFVFTGGSLINGETFVITEDGVTDLSQFPVVTLGYTDTAMTPEPASLLLMATGMACVGGLYLRRRVA